MASGCHPRNFGSRSWTRVVRFGNLRAAGQSPGNLLHDRFGIALTEELRNGLHHALAVRALHDVVRFPPGGRPVNPGEGEFVLRVANFVGPPLFRGDKRRRLLCRKFRTMRVIVFLRGIGCPTWIRTKTKASKGPCATFTPSDKPAAQ